MKIKQKFLNEKKYSFEDVLIIPQNGNVNSRKEVNIISDIYKKTKKTIMKNWKPIPIISSNMDTITGVKMAFELLKHNWIAVLHKYVSINEISQLFNDIEAYNKENPLNKIDTRNLFISRGTSEEDKLKLKERLKKEKRIISVCIDVANGHRKEVYDYIKELKQTICKDKILMLGNFANPEDVYSYIDIGVDILKIGIGPGSVCTTRIKTGIGYPQLSLVLDYRKKVLPEEILICADGGCKRNADIIKRFGRGADFVMIGGMLSGTTETPGEIEELNNKKYKRFSGMAAKESQHNGVPEYGREEGKTKFIPYKGKVKHIIKDIEGGIRSAGTYIGCNDINKYYENITFVLTNEQENKIYNNI